MKLPLCSGIFSVFLASGSLASAQDPVVTNLYVTVTDIVASPPKPGSFCSESPDPIILRLDGIFKSMDIEYNYDDCSQTNYTLSDCSFVTWEGDDIIETSTVTDSSRTTTDGKYPYCKTEILVRPKKTTTYKIKWVQTITQSATTCGPATILNTYYEGEAFIQIETTPPPPVLTVEMFSHEPYGELLRIRPNGASYWGIEWTLTEGASSTVTQDQSSDTPITVYDPFDCKDYQARFFTKTFGNCYSSYSNTVNSAVSFRPTINPGYSATYSNYVTKKLNESVGKPEYAYRKQYSCIQRRSANAFHNNPNGWAGGFPKYLFDRMAVQNPCESSVDYECSLQFQETCLVGAGLFKHTIGELAPGFFSYPARRRKDMSQWTSDHEDFITLAVKPCFDELRSDPEFKTENPNWDRIFAYTSEYSTVFMVQWLRTEAQLIQLPQIYYNEAINFLKSIGQEQNSTHPGVRLKLQAPPAKSDIFSQEIEDDSYHSVTTVLGEYYLKPGQQYQIEVTPKGSRLKAGPESVSSGQRTFGLSVDPSVATIDVNGLLTVKSTPLPTANGRFPLMIVVIEDNELVSVGQFAIYDEDNDGDLINDSFERSIGLDPSVRNDGLSDLDGDGLLDQYEVLLGTNPLLSDSDGDGYTDKFELEHYSNPLNSFSVPQFIDSASTGLWSQPGTWSCGCIPGAGDNVRILPNHKVTVDDESATAQSVLVDGDLEFNPGTKIKLSTPPY